MVNGSRLRHRIRQKAQVSIEYLIIFGIAFMMTLPLIVIYATQTGNIHADVTNVQVYRAASKIADYADQVYFLGKPSQRTIVISFPEGITEITVNGTFLTFNVTTAENNYVIIKETYANLTGEIRPFPGQHILVFKAEQDYVNITDKQ